MEHYFEDDIFIGSAINRPALIEAVQAIVRGDTDTAIERLIVALGRDGDLRAVIEAARYSGAARR